ncbi:MAG: hypothetical protein OEM59_15950 [Rhodospirillales bacterium]|nr:hypothetical protein [Rhodospirillales bacterium]
MAPKDGVLIEDVEGVVPGPGLPGPFSCNFRCTACATRFVIGSNVYRGADGRWRVLPD